MIYPKLFILLFSLLLTGWGCMSNPSDLPEPVGYDGFLQLGWQSIELNQYLDAFSYFQQAIDIDVTRAEGFLGVGVSSVFLEDYWHQADDYFQMAIQRDIGKSVIVQYLEESQTQDTLWTVFECVDPDLPPDSLNSWLSLTSDSGAVWVGMQIYNYLSINQLSTSLSFRFKPINDNAISCHDLYHPGSGWFLYSDSAASGYVYVEIPVFGMNGTEGIYYTWVMEGQSLNYSYATFDYQATCSQITLDALAVWSALQEVRSDEGDVLYATACAQGLLQIAPDYRFGAGSSFREDFFDMDIVAVTASGASAAFYNMRYLYSWNMCKQAGYGFDLNPDEESFLLNLLTLLMQMKGNT